MPVNNKRVGLSYKLLCMSLPWRTSDGNLSQSRSMPRERVSAFPTERRSYPVNPVCLPMCMQHASRLPTLEARTAERHAMRIVPQVPEYTHHWIIQALVQTSPGVHTHTRIHTQTMPCHAIQTIHTTQSITVKPIQTFPCQTRQTTLMQ